MCDNVEEIRGLLFKFKFFAENSSQFSFIEREKNMTSLGELGMCIGQAKNVILQLTPFDYVEGPLQDEKYPSHNLWVFGVSFNSDEVYIKLSDNFRCNVAKCISFHKAEYSLVYPNRNQEI